ncbi:GNAT family N-acetyltransferase [Candidatus Poribacteria bacterium]|nr:GNAT family N-acetyltransferase [Candidatus Poribacteria bacterium]
MDTPIEIIDYEPRYENWYLFIENRGFAGFDSPWTQSSTVEAYPSDILKTFLARMENMIVGLASLTEWLSFRPQNNNTENGAIELNSIGVLPEYRSRGVGSRLLEAVKQWSQEQGYRRIYAFLMGDVRWDLHRFYRRAGYELIEQWLELKDAQGRTTDIRIEDYWHNPGYLKQKIIDRGYIYCLHLTRSEH